MACAQQAVHRYCLNLRPSGAECPHTRNPVGHVQGWPVPALSRQEEGQYDPHRVDWMDHLLGSTSSRRGSRGFFLQLKQITDSESLFTALQSLTGTFFSPGSPWRARAVRASGHENRRHPTAIGSCCIQYNPVVFNTTSSPNGFSPSPVIVKVSVRQVCIPSHPPQSIKAGQFERGG